MRNRKVCSIFKKMKKFTAYSALLMLTLSSAGPASSFLPAAFSSVVSASTEITGQWGGATWAINGGSLTLSGGNIGSPSGLSSTLSAEGVDPSSITSICIANPMSASNIYEAFGNFSNLTTISGLSNLSYSGGAFGLFFDDHSMTTLDVSNFNTSAITDMTYMFFQNWALRTLDVSHFDTSNVTNMTGMFDLNSGSSALKSLDVSHFDTSKVTSMDWMFVGLNALNTLNVSNFNTSNVTSMTGMFARVGMVTSLDVSNFDTGKVTSFLWMFLSDSSLTNLDVSHFNTSRATDFSNMFNGVSSVYSLDLSDFTISSTASTDAMLQGMTSLSSLKLGAATPLDSDMGLPPVTANSTYTGNWINAGTTTNPAGSNVWTSSQLLTNYDPETMSGDTFVWESKDSTVTVATVANSQDYSTDFPYTSQPLGLIGEAVVKPVNSYHYNVVINDIYTYYSDLTVGAALSSLKVSLPDALYKTVYNRGIEVMTDSTGASATFVNVSFGDGKWYWVDSRALTTGAGSVSAAAMQYTSGSLSFPIYYIVNSFNPSGQIIWTANGSEYANEMRAAAAIWNTALGKTVFVENTGQYTDAQVTLKLIDKSSGATNPAIAVYTEGGGLYIDTDEMGSLSSTASTQIVEHELGHSLGLAHVMDYKPNSQWSSDIMSGYAGQAQAPTADEIRAINMLIANHNFDNPYPVTNPNVN